MYLLTAVVVRTIVVIQVYAHGFELGQKAFGWEGVNPCHPKGVLGCDAGECGATMHRKRHESAQIGLNPRPSTGIAAGNAEGDRGCEVCRLNAAAGVRCHGLRQTTGLRRLGYSSLHIGQTVPLQPRAVQNSRP